MGKISVEGESLMKDDQKVVVRIPSQRAKLDEGIIRKSMQNSQSREILTKKLSRLELPIFALSLVSRKVYHIKRLHDSGKT